VPDDLEQHERDSGMTIDFTLSIGYKRRRPDTQGDRLEARIDTFGLLLIGGIIAVAIILIVLPRVLTWLGNVP